jgi:hypothetical protein
LRERLGPLLYCFCLVFDGSHRHSRLAPRASARRRLTLDGLVIRLHLAASSDVCTLYLVFKEPRSQQPLASAVWRPRRGSLQPRHPSGADFRIYARLAVLVNLFFRSPSTVQTGPMRLAIKGASEKLALRRGP